MHHALRSSCITATLALSLATTASASSRQWDQTGPQNLTYSLSSTETPDLYGPFLVLIINIPPESSIPETDIRTFGQQVLTEICSKHDATPSITHIEESSRENISHWVWKGQNRSAWSLVRHCIPS